MIAPRRTAGSPVGPGPLAAALAAVLAAVALAVAGCGLGAQGAPDPVRAPTAAPTDTVRTPSAGTAPVAVYLLRGARLVAVERRGPPTAQGALDLLAAGPSPEETAEGIDTAIGPQSFAVEPGAERSGVAVVAVGPGFTELAGRQQLLAAGQLVWTVTNAPGVLRVRLQLDGEPLATPTDRGLTRSEVDRSDYRSVSPQP